MTRSLLKKLSVIFFFSISTILVGYALPLYANDKPSRRDRKFRITLARFLCNVNLSCIDDKPIASKSLFNNNLTVSNVPVVCRARDLTSRLL